MQTELLNVAVYQEIGTYNELKPTNSVLQKYNGGVINNISMTSQNIIISSTTQYVTFFIVKHGQALLGLDVSEAWSLLCCTSLRVWAA